MKYLIYLIFIFNSISIFSQQKIDTLYLSDSNKLVDKIDAVKYEIHAYKDSISGCGIVKLYSIEHHLISETEYINIKSIQSSHKFFTKNGFNRGYFDDGNIKYVYHYKLNKLDSIGKTYYNSGKTRSIFNYYDNKLNGSSKTFFENGQLQFDENYKDGNLHGDLKTYFENGTLKRYDVYDEGELISGHFYNEEGNEIEYVNYIINPEYEGGYSEISRFLSINLKYPRNMISMGIEGKVYISFTVKKNGDVDDVRILRSPHEELSKEALRIFNNLKAWKPGKKDGEFQDFKFSLPISFDLE
ncbi:TonB family protein [Litoribaculum gwangyangense]|uniref:TonB C-terminal domain-containing protein n=1 Tax=Litoribaculum gwangyangense TaxID=1130722 RepID=A0ABP9CS21_9FLAO